MPSFQQVEKSYQIWFLVIIITRPLPQFETYVKHGTFFSQVSVGALAVNNHQYPGSASMAESQGKAAYVWLTTFPNTWMESTTPQAADHACSLNHARPLNMVEQLNSAEKRQGTSGSKSDMPSGTPSNSGLKLKPLSTLVQKEMKEVQSGVDVYGQTACYLDASQVMKPLSSWAVMKLADFLIRSKKEAFWGSSFVLLVISGVETGMLNIQKAALILGVDNKELGTEMRKLRNEEKAFNDDGSLSKNALGKIVSEHCIRELGDCEDSMEENNLCGQACDQGGDIEKRGVKRKASNWSSKEGGLAWITGEVVAHLLKRSFAMKDQLFPLGAQHPVLVLKISWPFYESNVVRVVKEIEEYCDSEGLLMESPEVQDLLKAAQHLDRQQMEEGGYALAPAYNYSRCMLEKKSNYWGTGLPALLLQDVNQGVLPAEVAACQLGVTTTMIHSVLAKKKLWATQGRRSGPVTVQRYKKYGFGGEEDFWKEQTTVEMLQKV